MNFEIYDDFLTEYQANTLENALIKSDFPWYYHNNLNGKNKIGNFYFNHTLIEDGINHSDFTPLFSCILSKLKINQSKILRLKANLYPRTQLRVHHHSHTDYENGGEKFTVLYYVNTNNGYTIIDGKKKIKSKKNRILIFDGSVPHHSTTCTDVNCRSTVNFSCFL